MGEVSGGGGGGRGHKSGGAPKAKKMSTHIDMTPMVDLAFLLLTFFMLATTFSKPKAMEIIMPEEPEDLETQPPVNADRVLNLLAGENDKLFWYVGVENPQPEQTDYSPSGIRKVLMDKKREITARFPDKGMIVLIKVDDKARYKNMVDLFDEMNVTKQRSYAMVPITPDEAKLLDGQP